MRRLRDAQGKPRLLPNANAFLRAFLVIGSDVALGDYCHRPPVITGPTQTLAKALGILGTQSGEDADHDEPVMLLWAPGEKRSSPNRMF